MVLLGLVSLGECLDAVVDVLFVVCGFGWGFGGGFWCGVAGAGPGPGGGPPQRTGIIFYQVISGEDGRG